MSMWEQALSHLAQVITSTPATAIVEKAVEYEVGRALDAAALQLMEKVTHLAETLGVPAPILTEAATPDPGVATSA